MEALRHVRNLFLTGPVVALLAGGGCALFQPVTTPLPRSDTPVARSMEPPASQPAQPDPAAESPDPAAAQIEAWARSLAEQRARGDGRAVRLTADENVPDAAGAPAGDAMQQLSQAAGDPPDSGAADAPAAQAVATDREVASAEPSTARDAEPISPPPPAVAQPPTLLSVNVAPSRSAVSDTESTPGAAANQAQARDLAASLREFVARMPADANHGSLVEEVDARLLQALAGEAGAARSPLKYADPAQARLIEGMIDLVLALRDNPDASQLEQARNRLDRLQSTIREVSDLTIPTLALCTRVEGFGRYDELENAEFAAGARNEFVAYCELRNFASRQEPTGEYRSEFSLRLEVRNRLGDLVHQFASEDIVDRCRSPRTDCFIAPLVRLPAGLAAGEYVVKVTLIDKIGQKVAQQRRSLRIVAR
jgi:hypothetical protein